MRFQVQNSIQTLRQGLEEHRAANRGVFNYDNKEENELFFYPHDAVHVVFGLTTALEDEAVADAWTLFGTDVSIKKFYRFIRLETTREIFRRLSWSRLIGVAVRALPRIIRVCLRSRKMNAPWKWQEYPRHLDLRLCDIRKKHNIKIV